MQGIFFFSHSSLTLIVDEATVLLGSTMGP
jgi:hypothetical protein